MGDDSNVELEKILSASLERVSSWLRYAEAKHAAIMALASVWAVAILNYCSNPASPREMCAALLAGSPFVLGSVFVSLHSFIPITNLGKFFKPAVSPKNPNLLFFGHLASVDLATAGQTLRARYARPDGTRITQEFIDDISVQIVVNSQIAQRKFDLFDLSAGLALFGLAVIVGARIALLVLGLIQ